MIRLLQRKKGISLLEIVIAAFILAIAFIPILRVVDYGSVSTAKIGHYAKATRLAQELIEECKHVPFKTYQKQYAGLGSGESFDVHPQYYKETQKSIQAFITDSKDKLKDFTCTANLRPKKNDLGQIVEIWFEVVIKWRDLGKHDNAKSPERTIKVGNAYYNAESL